MVREMHDVEKVVGKELTYRGNAYAIDSYEELSLKGIPCVFLGLKPLKGKEKSRILIATKAFDFGNAISNDDGLNDFISKCNKDYDALYNASESKRLQDEGILRQKKAQEMLDKEEGQKRFLEEQRQEGLKKGMLDARKKVSSLYKIFTTITHGCLVKAKEYTKEFRDAYVVSYESEKQIMKKQRLIQQRALQTTLDSYPGDVDELLKWMKSNILRVDVVAPSDKIENEQMAVDALNERDGTSYKVKLKPGQYVGYEAWFKNPESAPEEFLKWKVSKHDYTTSNLSARVMEHPLNESTGKLTCNALVKELVYNDEYGFHMGSYK